MATVKRMAYVEHSTQQMYELVVNVNGYSDFLPWCSQSKIIDSIQNKMRASITIDFSGLNQSFSTLNVGDPPNSLSMSLIDGPFKKLDGSWKFTGIEGHGCKIDFFISYEFSNFILDRTVDGVFKAIATTLIDAFIERANELYG